MESAAKDNPPAHPVRYGVKLDLEAALNPEAVALVEDRLAAVPAVSLSGAFIGLVTGLAARMRKKR